jgi:hypothetical protein
VQLHLQHMWQGLAQVQGFKIFHKGVLLGVETAK